VLSLSTSIIWLPSHLLQLMDIGLVSLDDHLELFHLHRCFLRFGIQLIHLTQQQGSGLLGGSENLGASKTYLLGILQTPADHNAEVPRHLAHQLLVRFVEHASPLSVVGLHVPHGQCDFNLINAAAPCC
jgi:hypothetical protein